MRSWLLPSVLVGLSVICPFLLFKVQHYTQDPGLNGAPAGAMYYFYNEVTGEVQWEDPGNTPYEDENGARYWLSPSGDKIATPPDLFSFVWIEQYSEELRRPYFYNQETKESQWDRPPDLAWRRIRVQG